MTRLEIAARILAGWAANPNVSGTYEASAEVSLALADALLSAAGETAPGDQYEAGFRECQERAAKVCGVEAGLAKEAMDLITASVSIERARHAMRQNTALHLQEMIRALAPAAPMPSDPGAHLHHCPATAMRCPACPTGGPQACEQVPAAPKDAAPGCPDCPGRTRCESCDAAPAETPAPSVPVKPGLHFLRHTDGALYDEHGKLMARVPVVPAFPAAFPATPAPPVVPVKFDATGRAGEWARDGWDTLYRDDELRVTVYLRPGEDAGEIAARMLASVGRTL